MALFKNGDDLKSLPVDDTELSYKEKNMFDLLYPSETVQSIEHYVQQGPKKIWLHFKDIIIATSLFFILSLPFLDSVLSRFVSSENFYYRLAFKSIIFGFMFFIITNFTLSRN